MGVTRCVEDAYEFLRNLHHTDAGDVYGVQHKGGHKAFHELQYRYTMTVT